MVKGREKLQRQLGRFGGAIHDELVKQIEKEAARLVREMKVLVPVDSGDLRDSIGWTWGDAPPGAMVVMRYNGGRSHDVIAATIYAGSRGGDQDAFYAHFQEFGTVKTPASPFFFPVYRANRARIRRNLKNAVNRAVKKAHARK